MGVAHGGGFLKIVGAQAVAATHHMGHAKAKLAKVHERGIARIVLRNARNKFHLVAQTGQRHGHVGFTTAVVALKGFSL